jgi:hypothetical protein
MPSLYPLTLTQALANARLDLSDPASVQPSRWTDADLSRAISRALERYSWASPWIQLTQIPTIPICTIYPSPAGTWYIDRVEYPAGHYPKNFPPFLERKSPLIPAPTIPVPATSVAFSSGGSLSPGIYSWAASYVVPGGGETPLTTIATGTALNLQQATLTNIPTSTAPGGHYGVAYRNLYRTKAGGSQLYFLAQLPDDTTAVYVDAIADVALTITAPTTNTTQNLDQFELQIPPELYPSDATTYYLEVSYATLHQLDSSGTTIPERHWDVLYLGAVAYAMSAYLPQVNDNFEYADGHLRDRVDDTKSTTAWRTQCDTAARDFDQKLKLIKEEANAAIAASTHWGDVPLRWERL